MPFDLSDSSYSRKRRIYMRFIARAVLEEAKRKLKKKLAMKAKGREKQHEYVGQD